VKRFTKGAKQPSPRRRIGWRAMALDLPPLGTVDLDGPVAFREWDGPTEATFVLLHGLGGSHLSWIQAAPGLAGLGRVLAIDMPGFGRSPKAGRPARLMDQRRVLARFISRCASASLRSGVSSITKALSDGLSAPAGSARVLTSRTAFGPSSISKSSRKLKKC